MQPPRNVVLFLSLSLTVASVSFFIGMSQIYVAYLRQHAWEASALWESAVHICCQNKLTNWCPCLLQSIHVDKAFFIPHLGPSVPLVNTLLFQPWNRPTLFKVVMGFRHVFERFSLYRVQIIQISCIKFSQTKITFTYSVIFFFV